MVNNVDFNSLNNNPVLREDIREKMRSIFSDQSDVSKDKINITFSAGSLIIAAAITSDNPVDVDSMTTIPDGSSGNDLMKEISNSLEETPNLSQILAEPSLPVSVEQPGATWNLPKAVDRNIELSKHLSGVALLLSILLAVVMLSMLLWSRTLHRRVTNYNLIGKNLSPGTGSHRNPTSNPTYNRNLTTLSK